METFSIWHWMVVVLIVGVILGVGRFRRPKVESSAVQAKPRQPEKNTEKRQHVPTDEELYEKVADEINGGDLKRGLWARAFSESGGDKGKAQALYIRLRIEDLRKSGVGQPQDSNKVASRDSECDDPSRGFIAKLANGCFGLAKTYWIYWVLVGVVLSAVASSITSPAGLIALLLAYSFYSVFALLGVWRAATKYQGAALWVILAKMASVLGALMLLFNLAVALALLKGM